MSIARNIKLIYDINEQQNFERKMHNKIIRILLYAKISPFLSNETSVVWGQNETTLQTAYLHCQCMEHSYLLVKFKYEYQNICGFLWSCICCTYVAVVVNKCNGHKTDNQNVPESVYFHDEVGVTTVWIYKPLSRNIGLKVPLSVLLNYTLSLIIIFGFVKLKGYIYTYLKLENDYQTTFEMAKRDW